MPNNNYVFTLTNRPTTTVYDQTLRRFGFDGAPFQNSEVLGHTYNQMIVVYSYEY